MNWILFDEQFNYVSSSSGFEQVGADQEFKIHQFNGLAVNKNGYLYIYVSNETPNIDVFFDNLQVTHVRGPLVSEESFYPFGLSQAGISSTAVNFGSPINKKKKFQGQEYNDDLGVDMYEFKYRMDDPQIGRFWQVDPLSDKYVYNSAYAFSENHVTSHVELEGLEKVPIFIKEDGNEWKKFQQTNKQSSGSNQYKSTKTGTNQLKQEQIINLLPQKIQQIIANQYLVLL